MDDPIRLLETTDLAAMRDLCKELLAEVRALRAEVGLLQARPVYVPTPVYPSWPIYPPNRYYPIFTCGSGSSVCSGEQPSNYSALTYNAADDSFSAVGSA